MAFDEPNVGCLGAATVAPPPLAACAATLTSSKVTGAAEYALTEWIRT